MCASELIVLCPGYSLMKGAMYHLFPRSSIALPAISGNLAMPASSGLRVDLLRHAEDDAQPGCWMLVLD